MRSKADTHSDEAEKAVSSFFDRCPRVSSPLTLNHDLSVAIAGFPVDWTERHLIGAR